MGWGVEAATRRGAMGVTRLARPATSIGTLEVVAVPLPSCPRPAGTSERALAYTRYLALATRRPTDRSAADEQTIGTAGQRPDRN